MIPVPCEAGIGKASVTFSFSHQSDYAHWLYKELDARRREEVSGFVWRAPFRRVIKEVKDDVTCTVANCYPPTAVQGQVASSKGLMLPQCRSDIPSGFQDGIQGDL